MALLQSTALVLSTFAAAGMAVAQDDTDKTIEEVVVTGYHIKRFSTQGPAPVVVFDRESLESSGINTLNEFAQFLPQNAQTLSDSQRILSPTAGASNFNLRGIGNDATLTLINGRRMAPYGNGEFGTELFVDINAIPMASIDRVEILKDGASAVYGSDAVAGVVNIILKRDFTGYELEAGYLNATEGDLAESTVNFTAGWNWPSTTLLAMASYLDRSPLFDRDREYLADVDLSDRGGRNFRSAFSSPPTAVLLDSGSFVADPQCPENGLINNLRITPFSTSCRFNFAQFTAHIFESERLGSALILDHWFSDDLDLYAEVFWSNNQTRTVLAPGGLDDLLFVPGVHPNNPFEEDALIFYRPLDNRNRLSDVESRTMRAVAGLRGQIGNWDWDLGVMWSENDIETDGQNYVLLSAFQDALLGLGGPNGDQFYNPFGLNPQNSAEVLDSILIDTSEGAESGEFSADLLLASTLTSLAHGPLGLALGAQFRSQRLDEKLDPLSLAGEVGGGRNGTEIHEERDVWSIFAELGVPLGANLEAQLAIRHESYDEFGGTTNPKVALLWTPLDSLRLRASYGTSFRAPAFRELFDPEFTSVQFIVDDIRCAAGDEEACFDDFTTFVSRGNPDLEPEEGESWLWGLVWEPEQIEGLSVGIDFWRFEHDNRIILPQQSLFDICPDTCIIRAPATPQEVSAGLPGRITEVRSTYLNADRLRTRGIDVDLAYQWTSQAKDVWMLSVSHTHLEGFTFVQSAEISNGADFAGRFFLNPLPKNRGNVALSWTRGVNRVAAILHYVGEFRSDGNLFVDEQETDTPFIIDNWQSLDLQYAHTFERLNGGILRIGCQNCTDEDPSTFNTFATREQGLHDKRGSVVYLRWTQPFGN